MQPIVSKPSTTEFRDHYDQMTWENKKEDNKKEIKVKENNEDKNEDKKG
jgi:hypothetical protein